MENIELRDIIRIILKRWWIIVSITLVAVFVSSVVSFFFLDKVYATSTTLIVSQKRDGTTSNDMNINDLRFYQALVNTYSEIARSERVLEKIIWDMELDMTTSQLGSRINVESVRDTEIIRITVEDVDPYLATEIANSLAVVFQTEVANILHMDNVQIIDVAKVPGSPIRPRPYMNIAIAFILGTMAGLGVVFLIEFLDNTIKSREDIERYLELPVLGAIPSFDE